MLARLSLYLPRQPLRQFDLEPDKSYLIGRATGCDIRVSDDRLSRRHATLAGAESGWMINDLGSKNGLLIDGKPATQAHIEPPAWLSFGGIIASFESIAEETLAQEHSAAKRRRNTTRELGRALDPELGLSRLLSKTLESVLDLADLERGFVLLADKGGQMQVMAEHVLDEQTRQSAVFDGSWSAIDAALAKNKVLVYGDALQSQTLGARASVIRGEIRALACVPLQIADDEQGAVYGDSTKPGKQFTELDVELLSALGEQASTAIAVARVGQSLGELLQRDVMQRTARHD